jgi:hypothetical protein
MNTKNTAWYTSSTKHQAETPTKARYILRADRFIETTVIRRNYRQLTTHARKV